MMTGLKWTLGKEEKNDRIQIEIINLISQPSFVSYS